MIVKLIRMDRKKGRLGGLRDSIYALTRYVIDADPWAMGMINRQQVRSLAEYLVHAKAGGIEPGEKAGHIGGRNLMTSDLAEQQVEMLAVASSAPRVEYPIVHIIVSWQAGEKPTPAQLEDTVDTVLATTCLSRCPALFAEHTNTAHRHLHIAAVRVDPASGRATGSEWLIEDLHQAVAILDERHRWAAEPNALYYARDGAVFDAHARRFRTGVRGDKIVDPTTEVMVRDAEGRFISSRTWNGLPPDLLNARADILRARVEAKSWTDFHSLLDTYQVIYRAKGSGARLHLGNTSGKASTVAPDLALKQLEARWGTFIPHPRDQVPGFDYYRAAHQAQLKRLRADRDAVQTALNQWATVQLASIDQANNRLLERAIRAERDDAQKGVSAAFAAAIKACTKQRLVTAENWRAAGSPVNPLPLASPSLLLPANRAQEQAWTKSDKLRAEQHQWSTRYYDASDRLLFIDHRSAIVVHQPSHTDGLNTALKLAAERWGTVRVSGSEMFKKQCAERAAELGIALADSDNKPLVATRSVPPTMSETAPAVGTAPARANHRADPGRQAAIERVLADLARMGAIPMRRRQITGRADADAPLEILVDDDRFDPKPELTTASLFDEDPQIQAYLEKRRAGMLAGVNNHLRQFEVPLDRKAVVTSLHDQGGLARAAFLAFEDADFQSMLERVAVERAERQPSSQRADQRPREHPEHHARLAMLARLFHDQSWDPREWRSADKGLRGLGQSPPALAADDEVRRLEQQRRAKSKIDQNR